MNCNERSKDYLDGYSSQYNFKDENDIEHDLNNDIEEILKQNQELKEKLDKYEKQKEIIDKLQFIRNRKNQGASQENINKMAIELVNNYLKEVSE